MKIRKTGAGLFLALTLIGICAVNAFSADGYYTCTINRIGVVTADNGMITVRLTDTKSTPAFKNLYFTIPEGRLNQTLAILLTAASNGATVYVQADPVARTLSRVFFNVE